MARLVIWFCRRLSFNKSLKFGRWLGRKAWIHAKSERERAKALLAFVFDEKSDVEIESLSLEVFEHLGMAAAEIVNIKKIYDLSSYIELTPQSRKVLDEVLAKGQGVVYVSGHLGNWELMAQALAQLGYPINTIGQKSYDSRFTKLIARFRDKGGVKTVWRGAENIAEKMDAVLIKGEIFGLLIDQDTRVPGVFVPFFGKQAFTPTAAAILARKNKAPVVCGFNHRKKQGGYRIVIEEVSLCELEDFKKAVAEDTKVFTALIEENIRAHPAEWVWMHKRYKTRP